MEKDLLQGITDAVLHLMPLHAVQMYETITLVEGCFSSGRPASA